MASVDRSGGKFNARAHPLTMSSSSSDIHPPSAVLDSSVGAKEPQNLDYGSVDALLNGIAETPLRFDNTLEELEAGMRVEAASNYKRLGGYPIVADE
jgi:hypothetical protein